MRIEVGQKKPLELNYSNIVSWISCSIYTHKVRLFFERFKRFFQIIIKSS